MMQDFKNIRKVVEVSAGREDVWNAWTTPAGMTSFFAPETNIKLTPGGLYEVFFFPDEEKGRKGAEDTHVLSYLPFEMLSFSWSAPAHFPHVREERTIVVIRLESIDSITTRLTLDHHGWKEGSEWDAAYLYFVDAWDVVLSRLLQRFEKGPVDWNQR
jgi:uncharacterized protein YndB with AHSA1/START domain